MTARPGLLLRYAATQILRAAVGELTIDYLRGAPQPAQLVLCSGFLDKRSPKTLMGVSAWQTRWFELTPTALTYWEPMEAGIEAAKRKEGDLDSLKPVYRGCIELSEMVGVRVDSKNEMRFELLMKSKRLFQLSAMDAAERQKWARAVPTQRHAAHRPTPTADALQLDVLSASAGAVTLAAPTEEAVYAEEGADAVDGGRRGLRRPRARRVDGERDGRAGDGRRRGAAVLSGSMRGYSIAAQLCHASVDCRVT